MAFRSWKKVWLAPCFQPQRKAFFNSMRAPQRKKFVGSGLRATKWTGVENEDVKATVFGDTVVVTGTFKAKGSASGKPIDEHTRYTDVWVKMPNGKWQCVSSQDSPVKM
jgi:ketosteroid isomerase-like protein